LNNPEQYGFSASLKKPFMQADIVSLLQKLLETQPT
jgi:hypothetical protein